MKVGKFFIGRDFSGRCIRWLPEPKKEGDTLVFSYRRIPPQPKSYGFTIAIEPDALDPKTVFEAVDRLLRNALLTSANIPKGLDIRSLSLFYVAATKEEPNTLISWKAMSK